MLSWLALARNQSVINYMIILALPLSASDNPYVDLLYSHMPSNGVVVKQFSLANVRERCDICHIHWPDSMLTGNLLRASINKVIRFWILLLWVKLRWGAKIVWTVHNLEPHERALPIWWRRFFYSIWFRFVDGAIFMSDASRVAFEKKYEKQYESTVIPHGHYCDVYEKVVPDSQIHNELTIQSGDFVFGNYGKIREYKNIPYLMREFSKLNGDHYKLIVAGKVRERDHELLAEIEGLAAQDARIHFLQGFVSDERMKALYERTDYAVLPYRDILNSGSALLALSLGCSVLVPALPTMKELQSQLNSSFVRLIPDTGLTEEMITCSAHTPLRCQRSDLLAFEWNTLSSCLYEFYRQICSEKGS